MTVTHHPLSTAERLQLQSEEALDELVAERLHGYGAGLEDLRAPKPVQVQLFFNFAG